MITKMLVSAAIVLGSLVAGAAPTSADPNHSDASPNPFGGLGCNCRETAAPGSPALTAEINRGIQRGHSAWLPGLPAPTQPQQPKP